jgi:hypothetical protein
MEAGAFADGVLKLLRDKDLAATFAARGPAWVRSHRTYDILGQTVAEAYQRILTERA